jgi:hypothetical protein
VTQTELHCAPRFGTPRTPGRPTLGPRAAAIAKRLGFPMMPHQRLIADVALEIDPDTGLLAYNEVDIIINRQGGKSRLALPMMTHRCTGFDRALSEWVRRELGHHVPEPGPQRVFYTAQRAEDARQRWRDDHVAKLKNSPFGPKIEVRKRLASETMFWPNGSTWVPGSTTGKSGGTGDTIDMPFIDEAWCHSNNRTELSMRPAMLTRPWRQLWVMSMIPGLSRAAPGTWSYLRTKRQNGRARVDANINRGVAYFEWSADPGMDPADPATWWSCMPALGRTVQEKAIREDFESGLPLIDFCAEYLGWEPQAQVANWSTISEATWLNLRVPRVRSSHLDPVAIGVEAQPDLSMSSIGMAALDVNGDIFVDLIDRKPGITWLVDALCDIVRANAVCAIGIAEHSPAAPIIEPLRRALFAANLDIPVRKGTSLVRTMQGPAVSRACRQFYTETGEIGEDVTGRRIRHADDPELNASVAAATKYQFGDEWRWMRAGEGTDASPLYAVTLARAAGEDVEWVGGAYDLADSLG